ncbi:MAG: hypothetical protein ACKO41_02345 [Sphingomonadales bacterium]
MKTNSIQDLVVFSWNGREEPLQNVQFDTKPSFTICLFNYSGSDQQPTMAPDRSVGDVFSFKTEFKGELLLRLQEATAHRPYRYIGVLDDDHQISISSINRLLEIATDLAADSFQPSIDPRSFYSHRRFLQKPGAMPERVGWIEIMAPFVRKEIFDLAAPFYSQSISSYGIDRYVYPYIQRKYKMDRRFLIHEITLRHLKPVTSGLKLLSNGLDALEEYELLRLAILQKIRVEKVPFTRWELFRIYEVGMPPLFKWRDNFIRAKEKWSGKR